MTNTINNKMAGKNSVERCSASKTRGKKVVKMATSPPRFFNQRQSPTSVVTGRGSPSSAEKFAGAKWTDPPAPTALPPPPIHWMKPEAMRAPLITRIACNSEETPQLQLKMLLKGQA